MRALGLSLCKLTTYFFLSRGRKGMDQMEHFYNNQGLCFLHIPWRSSVLLLPLKKISLSCLPMNFVLAFLNLLPYLMAYLVSWNNKLYFYLCDMF